MQKTNLLTVLQNVQSERRALAHFNVSTAELMRAIAYAARDLGVPVVIGLSEGERDFVGIKQSMALAKSLREEGCDIYLNADHTYSYERCVEALDAGFDSVIIDGAKLPYGENVNLTKKVVAYARATWPDVIVEGEFGYIGQSSAVIDKLPEGVDMERGLTDPLIAKRFVDETGVRCFAPAVGNVHGIIRSGQPSLRIPLIREIRAAVPLEVPLVLHGGSGTPDDQFTAAIDAGIGLIHVSTELRVAYRDALVTSLSADSNVVAPYKYMAPAVAAVAALAKRRMELFTRRW